MEFTNIGKSLALIENALRWTGATNVVDDARAVNGLNEAYSEAKKLMRNLDRLRRIVES